MILTNSKKDSIRSPYSRPPACFSYVNNPQAQRKIGEPPLVDCPVLLIHDTCSTVLSGAVAYRGGFGGLNPPPPKFRRPSKIVPNSTRLWKLLKIAEFRTPKPQDVWEKSSKILKLPPVRNWFTLAMTNKLAVIINSLKIPKIKINLLYEISCTKLQLPPKPLTRGLPPPDPYPLSSTEFIELHLHIPEKDSLVRHWSGGRLKCSLSLHYKVLNNTDKEQMRCAERTTCKQCWPYLVPLHYINKFECSLHLRNYVQGVQRKSGTLTKPWIYHVRCYL